MDHKIFVSKPKSLAIAPAGHGKTHAITDCLLHTAGKQLILTHTHAGIFSIQEKLKRQKITSSTYNVETISSYAQKIVFNFYTGTDLPPQESGNQYYQFLIQKATELIQIKPIRDIVAATYTGLFVDEYQDCTISQHNFILTLSTLLPTRLFGDPLQGIFYFGEPLVNLEDSNHMGDFLIDTEYLTEPHRWKGINEPLGQSLKQIRTILETSNSIDMRVYKPTIELVIVPELDLYNNTKPYYKNVSRLLAKDNILLIDPDSTSVIPRVKKIAIFQNRMTLLESIDDKSFYSVAKFFDTITPATSKKTILSVAHELFSPKSSLNEWFTENDFKKFKKEEKIIKIKEIVDAVASIEHNYKLSNIPAILKSINKLPDIKCYRRELLRAIMHALSLAEENNISVYEAMVLSRNKARRIGRKVYGRCIGTTLLTKGLEFDAVVVLNAHKFDKKNFYVALTRARKELIVFSNSPLLTFRN
jgi:superfamily I DNA/RNA helicase